MRLSKVPKMTHSIIDIMRKPVELKPKTKGKAYGGKKGKKISKADRQWLTDNYPKTGVSEWIEKQRARFGVCERTIRNERPIK